MEFIRLTGMKEGFPSGLIDWFVRKAASNYGDFNIEEITPLEAARNINIPILMIHGGSDDFVSTYMSHDMKKANDDIKLEIFPGAGHGMSYITDPERYEESVNAFIDETMR